MSGKSIKIKMLEMDINNRSLSMATGIHYTTLSQIISGRINPTKEEKQAICLALNASQDELFKMEQEA